MIDVAVHDLMGSGWRVYSRVPGYEGRIVRSALSVRGSSVEIRDRRGRTMLVSFDRRFDDLQGNVALQQRPGGRVWHVVGVSGAVAFVGYVSR